LFVHLELSSASLQPRGNALFEQLYRAGSNLHTSPSSGKQKNLESKESTLSSSGKHKPTIKTGKLLVTEQWFLGNKKEGDAHKMWLTRIELGLDCLSFYFNKAVKIIRPDVDKTLRLIVRRMPHVKRFHLCCLAGPNNSERPPWRLT
jgi:hypothetical protein